MTPTLRKQIVWFLVIGFVNTAVDLIVLNIGLMVLGSFLWSYPLCKAFSSLVATTQSYFLNTRFTFSGSRGNAFVFFSVTAFGMLVNVGCATLLFYLAKKWGIAEPWSSNGAAILATGGNMITNFLGYKYVVFRKTIHE